MFEEENDLEAARIGRELPSPRAARDRRVFTVCRGLSSTTRRQIMSAARASRITKEEQRRNTLRADLGWLLPAEHEKPSRGRHLGVVNLRERKNRNA
jgi:hypothetical protein